MKQRINHTNSEQLLARVASDIRVPSFEQFQQMMVTNSSDVRYTYQRNQSSPWFRRLSLRMVPVAVPLILAALVISFTSNSPIVLTSEDELVIDELTQEMQFLSQEDAATETVVAGYMNQLLVIGDQTNN